MIKVSIIIPVYNTEKYVATCIASVLRQSYPDLEIIVIEDKSTDNSLCKVREIVDANPDADIKVFAHEENKGLSEARNTGIRNAVGDYLFFVDSDDFIPPWSIACLVDTLQQYPLAELVYGARYEFHNETDITILKEPDKSRIQYFDDKIALKKMILSERSRSVQFATNVLIKRKWLIENNLFYPSGLLNEDFYWNFFAAKYSNHLAISDSITYFYRYNPEGIMATLTRRIYADNLKIIISRFVRNLDSVCLGSQIFLIMRKIHTYYVYRYDLFGQSLIVRYLFVLVCLPYFLVSILLKRR